MKELSSFFGDRKDQEMVYLWIAGVRKVPKMIGIEIEKPAGTGRLNIKIIICRNIHIQMSSIFSGIFVSCIP